MATVVDASVALKWVLDEEFSDRAEALLNDCLVARRRIVGPPHLLAEVTNALYQRVRRNTITTDEGESGVLQFLRFPIESLAPAGLYHHAYNFARAHGLSALYDSLYIVLAQLLEAELWTDDRRILRTLGSVAPWVRWIGDYPLS